MHRFFLLPDWLDGDSVILTGDTARQIARVLRLGLGDRIIVLDNSGWEYTVELANVSHDSASGRIVDKAKNDAEPSIIVSSYQAMIRPERFEFILQKGTELGVSHFVPVVCERSVTSPDGNRLSPNRRQRWKKIITEAAEQCGRGRLPTLSDPITFIDACSQAPPPAIIPWEAEDTLSIRAALRSILPSRIFSKLKSRPEPVEGRAATQTTPVISIFIGPEGGLTHAEIETARKAGITPVSLGKRILRSETAAIATIAAVMYKLGELGR